LIKESSQKPCQKPIFIVKNETFTGLILMAPFFNRRALQMRYIGLLRRPDLSTTGLVSAFSGLGALAAA